MTSSEDHGHDGHHVPPLLPEPKTPMWLPALGGVIFVLAGALFVAMPRTATATPQEAPADAGAAPAH